MPTERPTWGEVQEKLTRRKTTLAAMYQQMRVDQSYIDWASGDEAAANGFAHQRIKSFPIGYQFKLPPLAWLAVQTQRDHVKPSEMPNIRYVLPPGKHRDDEKAKEHIDRVQQGLKGLYYRLTTFAGNDPASDLVDNAGGIGLGALFYPMDLKDWPKNPYPGRSRASLNADEQEELDKYNLKMETAFPWAVRSINPINTVYFDTDHDPPWDVILEERLSPKAETLTAIASSAQGGASGTDKTSTRITYVSADWFGQWIDGVPYLTSEDGADAEGITENRGRSMPLGLAWSGMGRQDELGSWEIRGQGIVRNARHAIDVYTACFNYLEILRSNVTLPGREVIGRGDDGQAIAAEEAEQMKGGPDAFWIHSDRVTISVLEQPQVPPVLFQEMDRNEVLIERLLGSDVLQGRYREEPASKTRTRAAFALSRYGRLKENCEQVIAVMLMNMAWQIKHVLSERLIFPSKVLGKDVMVNIDPDDLIDGAMVYVDLAPATEEERAAKVELGLRLRTPGPDGKPGISHYRFLNEHVGLDDPQGELDDLLFEQLDNSPIIMELMGRAAVNALTRKLPILQQTIDQENIQKGNINLPDQQKQAQMAPTNGGSPGGPPETQPFPTLGGPMEAQQAGEAVYRPY